MAGNESSNTEFGNSTHGRPSAAVYRRRRIVAGIVALLVVIGLITGITAVAKMLGGDEAAASDSAEATIPGPNTTTPGAAPAATAPAAEPSASAEPNASPKPGETGTAAALCPTEAVQVSATTDALSYSTGANPMLTMTITNNGAEPCDVNVGTSQMEFIITSGSDRIFSSADCQQASEDLLKTVKPQSVETAKFSWERQRSAPGCAEVPSNPNPGTYMFSARLGGVISETTVFDLE